MSNEVLQEAEYVFGPGTVRQRVDHYLRFPKRKHRKSIQNFESSDRSKSNPPSSFVAANVSEIRRKALRCHVLEFVDRGCQTVTTANQRPDALAPYLCFPPSAAFLPFPALVN